MSSLRRRLAVGFLAISAVATGIDGTAPAYAEAIGTDPQNPSEATWRDAVRVREMFGLSVEAEDIRDSLQNPVDFPDVEWGAPLSRAEAAEAARRVTIQESVGPAAVWADTHLEGFAGLWFDIDQGGQAVFLTSRSIEAAELELSAKIPVETDYDVRPAARSWEQLLELQAAVEKDRLALTKAGLPIVSTAIDTPFNRVVVGLTDVTDDADRVLIARYGDGVSVRLDEVVATADSCPETNCLPAKAGIDLGSAQIGNPCTTGFIVRMTTSGTGYYAILTAGHCFRAGGDSGEGDDWYHSVDGPDYLIGEAEKQTWYDGADADVGVIDFAVVPADRNEMFVDWYTSSGYFPTRSMTDIAYNVEQGVNGQVCRMGAASGRTCGRIRYVSVTRPSVISGIGTRMIDRQNEVDFDSIGGDSGGPYFLNESGYGIHIHSGTPSEAKGWYSTMTWMQIEYESRWGQGWTYCLTNSCS